MTVVSVQKCVIAMKLEKVNLFLSDEEQWNFSSSGSAFGLKPAFPTGLLPSQRVSEETKWNGSFFLPLCSDTCR
jgi:hypothetical protein